MYVYKVEKKTNLKIQFIQCTVCVVILFWCILCIESEYHVSFVFRVYFRCIWWSLNVFFSSLFLVYKRRKEYFSLSNQFVFFQRLSDLRRGKSKVGERNYSQDMIITGDNASINDRHFFWFWNIDEDASNYDYLWFSNLLLIDMCLYTHATQCAAWSK